MYKPVFFCLPACLAFWGWALHKGACTFNALRPLETLPGSPQPKLVTPTSSPDSHAIHPSLPSYYLVTCLPSFFFLVVFIFLLYKQQQADTRPSQSKQDFTLAVAFRRYEPLLGSLTTPCKPAY